MNEHKQEAIASVKEAQRQLLSAQNSLARANKLAVHIPEYQELATLVVRLTNLTRALGKLDL